MIKIRYALDQTMTRKEAYNFLTEKAKLHNATCFGYYKGNGKQETDIIEVYGKVLNQKPRISL